MGIIVIIAFLVYLILSGYVIVNSFKDGKKILAISSTLFILTPTLLTVLTAPFNILLSYPFQMLVVFLAGNLFLLISIAVTKKSRGKQYIIFVIAFVLASCISFTVTSVFYLFGDKVILKHKLHDGIYLNINEYFDNGYRVTYLTIENPIYVKRKLSSKISDSWIVPDEVKFISLKDSMLTYSIRAGDLKETIEINLRFDHVYDLLNGVSIVRLWNQTGAIDSTGKIIIPIGKYQSLSDNHGNLMLAQNDGKWGYINKEGKVVIPFTFSGGGNFLGDSTTVVIGTKYYYINKKGKLLREYNP